LRREREGGRKKGGGGEGKEGNNFWSCLFQKLQRTGSFREGTSAENGVLE